MTKQKYSHQESTKHGKILQAANKKSKTSVLMPTVSKSSSLLSSSSLSFLSLSSEGKQPEAYDFGGIQELWPLEDEKPVALVDSPAYAQKINFFENLKEIPDIENISEDISVVDEDEVESKSLTEAATENKGEFVGPPMEIECKEDSLYAENKFSKTKIVSVDQQIEPQTEVIAEPKPEPAPKIASETQIDELQLTESEMFGSQTIELILPDEAEFFENVRVQKVHSDRKVLMDTPADIFLDTFLHMADDKCEEKIQEIDGEAMARIHNLQQQEKHAKDFLHDLIDKVVENCELRSRDEILAQSLDKRQLLVEFAKKAHEYKTEINYKYLLERKIVDHLKRQKLYSHILPRKNDSSNKKKYHEALEQVEHQLAREKQMKKNIETTKNSLLNEFRKGEEKLNNQIEAFETLVKTKLSKNDPENVNHVSQYFTPFF